MKIQENVELKNYTTYKVGGPAEYFCIAESKEDLIEAIKYSTEKGFKPTILGGGSNVIVSDRGLKGLIILNKYEDFSIKGDTVTAGSGLSLSDFVEKLLAEGKGGLEFLANIPGSVGGAVAVNAGCYGKYVDAYLLDAEIFEDGRVEKVGPEYFNFEYRNSKLKKGHPGYVISATFEIKDVDVDESKRLVEEDRSLRDTKHPKDPSCGSFFKNPSRENTAGGLIEKSGLSGFQIGGAKVSEKHCNFLINIGNAKANDLKELSEHVRKIVKEKTGYELEEEAQYLGEF